MKQVRQEHPLRHFLGTAELRCGACRHRLRLRDMENACCAFAGNERRLVRLALRLRHHVVVHNDRAHSGEVETAQERARRQLARAANVHQQLHQRGADLAELPGEFVSAWQFIGIVLARQKFIPFVAERVEDSGKGPVDALGLFFRINTAAVLRADGKSDAQHLLRLFIAQRPHVVGKERQTIRAREKHIDRQTDAERLRDLSQTCLQIPPHGGQLVGGVRPGKDFAVKTDHDAARSLRAAAHHRLQVARLKPFHHLDPRRGIGQHPRAGFRENHVAREPDIGGSRRRHIVVLKHLPCQQFRFNAGTHQRRSLGRAGVANEEEQRQVANIGALRQFRTTQPRFRFPNQDVHFISATAAIGGGSRGAVTLGF